MTNTEKQFQTRSQKMAQKAFKRVREERDNPNASPSWSDYVSFSKSFPAMIQSCGLIQALLFAQKKKYRDFLDDFYYILTEESSKNDFQEIRCLDTVRYIKLSRLALEAATWIKRYAEALTGEEEGQ